MKKLLFIPLLLFLFFLPSVVKAQTINVTIVSPAATGRYQDVLNIVVGITSTYAMDTVKATVSGRSVLLTRNPSDGYFEGTLSLTGLAQGLHQMDIYTLDALGNSLHTLRQFTYDSYPIVTIQSPTSYTFYQNKVHIKATVSDPGHTNCAGTVYYPNNISIPTYSFSFVNSIDTLVDLYPES
ncbi:MAG TPA: hypothetical protein VFE54_08295, partial [Mucilaginibacter sp.]|nr:hypothetical protein [Mucilaginibacter sp.]